jgi:hypothetical protein
MCLISMRSLVRARSARHREPLVLGGHERSASANQHRRSEAVHRLDLGRRSSPALGSNPTSSASSTSAFAGCVDRWSALGPLPVRQGSRPPTPAPPARRFQPGSRRRTPGAPVDRATCGRPAGSWSWGGSSSGPGPLRTAAPAQSSRSRPTSWGRASVGRRQRPPRRRGARAGSRLDQRCANRPPRVLAALDCAEPAGADGR